MPRKASIVFCLQLGSAQSVPALLRAQVDVEAVSSGESSRNTELVRALLQERQIEAIPVKMHQRREVLNIGGDLSEQLPLLQGGFAQPLEELETGIVQRVQAADEIDSGSLRERPVVSISINIGFGPGIRRTAQIRGECHV